jgi:hypothetical protein
VSLQVPKAKLDFLSAGEEPFRKVHLDAAPVSADRTSAWSILPKGMTGIAKKIRGTSNYTARIGAHSGGAAGIFWVDILETRKNKVVISNRWDAGRNKYKSVTASVEAALVHPLVRGRDVKRWLVEPSASIMIPYQEENSGHAITESQMKREFPLAFEYFENFRAKMFKRPHYVQHFKPSGAPYWSMYNVGNYSFAKSRVVWREQTSSFRCAVVEQGKGPTAIADAKLIVVACSNSDEAHYLAAVLNSAPARFLIDSYVVNVQVSTHILQNLHVAMFSASSHLHLQLAEQSRKAHKAAADRDFSSLATAERRIDELSLSLWGLDHKSLERILSSLSPPAEDGTPEDEE